MSKQIIVRESELSTSKEVIEAKMGKTVKGKKITDIIVIPEWVIQAIKAGKIKS